MADFDLGSIQTAGSSGIDALFEREPQIVRPKTARVRVASVQQLKPFARLSAETLIHKSERDLWAIKKEADGNLYIERLFDDNGSPLKG
jgi:hypothetical protein